MAAGMAPLAADPGFVHLSDGRLLTGTAVRVPEPGGLVRLKLASIDGWLLGILDPRLHRAPPPAQPPVAPSPPPPAGG